MYLFRALNNWNTSTSIVARAQMNNGVIADALKLITTHLQDGSSIGTCWISSSKDFNYVAEEYSIPQNKTHNHLRVNIAVLYDYQTISSLNSNQLIYLKLKYSNLSQVPNNKKSPSVLVLSNGMSNSVSVPINYIYNIYISTVNELIIDFKDRDLAQKGVILKKVPKELILSNPQYGLGNATKAKEVLFLNQINPSYIRCTLTPLEIDVLYSFSKADNPDFLTILNNINITHNLNYNQKYNNLFVDLYLRNRNMHDIAYGLTGKNYDILSVYTQLKNYKRELLLDIIRNINYGSINLITNIQQMQVKDIKIVEDVLDIIAIDKPKNLPTGVLTYGGLSINTSYLPLGNPTDYNNFNDAVLAVNYSNIPVFQGSNTNQRLTWLSKSTDEEINRNEKMNLKGKYDGCSSKEGFDKLLKVTI